MTAFHHEKTAFVRHLIERMWMRAGASEAHAARIADVVTLADRLGKHQQGIGVLEVLYPGWVAGDIDLEATPEVVDEGPTWAVVDGHRSTGFYAISIAMEQAIEKARTNGVGIGMARNHWDA